MWKDTDTAIRGTNRRFPSTQLTLLKAVTRGLTDEALARVIALYWKPVYHFIRVKFGKSKEDAKDLTQGFLRLHLSVSFLCTSTRPELHSEHI